ncbi:MAG: glutathionylspermidine synthase family protein [Cyanobacteria bacterium]|nr:glutathionylspermidine synthase family protein [Cyanobacteriota bacterium]
MQRHTNLPRPNWQKKNDQIGFSYHSIGDVPYWKDDAHYEFTGPEVDGIEAATQELYNMCVETVDDVVKKGDYDKLAIPEHMRSVIQESWERDDKSLLGRFDLAYSGEGPPKMLEFNADTPTSLPEASLAQWHWLKDLFPKADQFNSIHEKLVASWADLKNGVLAGVPKVHFTLMPNSEEDLGNIEYLRDTARQGGLITDRLMVGDVGWDANKKEFVDLKDEKIQALFKLYPWEWLAQDDFGKHFKHNPLTIFEPAWKMVMSNKGILPLLWNKFKGHPNLLPASFGDPSGEVGEKFVKKPILSREGANITIFDGTTPLETTGGTYGKEGFVSQSLADIPSMGGNYPVIGSWVIGGEAAGMGVREAQQSRITSNTSLFIPHLFRR